MFNSLQKAFDHLSLCFNAVITVLHLVCKIGVNNQYAFRAYWLCTFFRNDQGVCLLEHVRLFENIQYGIMSCLVVSCFNVPVPKQDLADWVVVWGINIPPIAKVIWR